MGKGEINEDVIIHHFLRYHFDSIAHNVNLEVRSDQRRNGNHLQQVNRPTMGQERPEVIYWAVWRPSVTLYPSPSLSLSLALSSLLSISLYLSPLSLSLHPGLLLFYSSVFQSQMLMFSSEIRTMCSNELNLAQMKGWRVEKREEKSKHGSLMTSNGILWIIDFWFGFLCVAGALF